MEKREAVTVQGREGGRETGGKSKLSAFILPSTAVLSRPQVVEVAILAGMASDYACKLRLGQ